MHIIYLYYVGNRDLYYTHYLLDGIDFFLGSYRASHHPPFTNIFDPPGEIYHPFKLSITYPILIQREMKCSPPGFHILHRRTPMCKLLQSCCSGYYTPAFCTVSILFLNMSFRACDSIRSSDFLACTLSSCTTYIYIHKLSVYIALINKNIVERLLYRTFVTEGWLLCLYAMRMCSASVLRRGNKVTYDGYKSFCHVPSSGGRRRTHDNVGIIFVATFQMWSVGVNSL